MKTDSKRIIRARAEEYRYRESSNMQNKRYLVVNYIVIWDVRNYNCLI